MVKAVWYKRPLYWLFNTGPGNLALIVLVMAALIANVLITPASYTLASYLYIAGIFGIVLFGFALNYGPPGLWWVPFFGHDVLVKDLSVIIAKQQDFDGVASEQDCNRYIDAWLKESGIKRVYRVNYARYRFLHKADAVRFKMSWWRV